MVERLQHIYGMIAPALAVMDPPLAETLLVRVPLTWATSDDAIRRKQGLAVLIQSWELFFGYEQQEILLQALLSVLALCRRRWLHTANVGARPFWRSWMVAN